MKSNSINAIINNASQPISAPSEFKNEKGYEVYGPYEREVNKTFNGNNATKQATADSDNPTKHETLGQNQLAAMVAHSLSTSLVWDTSSGQWFQRTSITKPYQEKNAECIWMQISLEIEKLLPKYSASTVNGVERFVKARLAISSWLNDRNLLPLSNGVFDLRSRTLRDYQNSDRFNWQLPYAFQSDAQCPLIDKTLSRMVGANSELISFLHSWLLVVLLGRYDVQAFLELVGDGGTGKSTFLKLLGFVVGEENVHSTDLNSLERNQFETAAIYGKRLTIITDSARYRNEVPILKSITGGDPVRLERKHQQQRKPFVYDGLVAIAANQPLESNDYSSGLKRRRRAIEINYRLTDGEKKPYQNKCAYPDGFEGALKREMSGLLNKLLALDISSAVNCVANPEAAMQSQSLSIELETNPLLAWANEQLVRCAGGETRIGNRTHRADDGLYCNYCDYVEASGQKPLSLTRFGRALLDILKSHGINTRKERSAFTFLVGLRLRRATDAQIGRLVSELTSKNVELRAENNVTEEFEGSVECE